MKKEMKTFKADLKKMEKKDEKEDKKMIEKGSMSKKFKGKY